jgi:monoamine oxidase
MEELGFSGNSSEIEERSKPPTMAKTPLYASLMRALKLAKISEQYQIPADEVSEWLAEQRIKEMSRRDFVGKALYGMGGLALMSMVPSGLFKKSASDTRIAIVGAGIAGLHAAWILKKNNVYDKVTIYEGSGRTGGRMFTQKLNGNDGTTELGGEFIDYNHFDMLNLADYFGIKKLYKHSDDLIPDLFFIDGKKYLHEDAVRAFQSIRVKVGKDSEAEGDELLKLDRMSMEEYFQELTCEEWFKKMLAVAYKGEMGLELADQSALNFIMLIGAQDQDTFDIFGDSDESIKFKGGNQQICDRLAGEVEGQIRLNHALVRVKSKGSGFVLSFAGEAKDVEADIVIMTVPYTVLRFVDGMKDIDGMTADKWNCIENLGAGTNGKYFLDMKSRIWREQGFQGYLYTNNIDTSWDSYHLQNYNAGKSIYSVFFGGKTGEDISKGGGEAYLDEVNTAFPGFKSQYTGYTSQMNWTKYKWSLGSYICPRPGQYSTLMEHVATPVGNMYFAGEHTSVEFGGFMNGAAESGRLVAQQVMKRVW